MRETGKRYEIGVTISWYDHESGNLIVRLHNLDQQLSINPNAFWRILEINTPVIVGSRVIPARKAAELGFIFPRV